MTRLAAVAFAALAAICLTLAVIAFTAHMPDPADAQPDYTPPDEPDPVDAADDTLPDWIRRLRDDMTACEPDGWVLDMYQYLDKERSK